MEVFFLYCWTNLWARETFITIGQPIFFAEIFHLKEGADHAYPPESIEQKKGPRRKKKANTGELLTKKVSVSVFWSCSQFTLSVNSANLNLFLFCTHFKTYCGNSSQYLDAFHNYPFLFSQITSTYYPNNCCKQPGKSVATTPDIWCVALQRPVPEHCCGNTLRKPFNLLRRPSKSCEHLQITLGRSLKDAARTTRSTLQLKTLHTTGAADS